MPNEDLQAMFRAVTPPHVIRPWPLPTAASPRIQRLREDGDQSSLLQQLEEHGAPLIEPGDAPGTELFTFIWHGSAPHGVLFHAAGITDQLDPANTLMEHIPGTDIHALTLEMPSTWQAGYLFAPIPGPIPGPSLHKPVDLSTLMEMMSAMQQDRFARDTIPNKLGARAGTHARHGVVRGSDAPTVALWRNEPAETVECEPLLGPGSRAPLPVRRWSHPLATNDAPVITLLDGEVWREQFPIVPEIAARVGDGMLPPVHVVFVESPDPTQRALDLATEPEAMGLMLEDIRARMSPLDGPMILAGQSLGGLFGLHAAGRFPDLVAAVVAQSPSVWWPNVPPTSPGRPDWFAEQSSEGGSPVIVHGGALEWVMRDRIRDAVALLRVQDRLIDDVEFMGGHDILAWQSLLPEGISKALLHLRG